MIMLHDLKNVIYLPHEDLSTLLHSWYKRKDNLNYLYNTTIGSTDQDMLASDCSPTPDLSGKVGLNLAFCLVTSCCSHKTEFWGPACRWLGRGSMSIGEECH